MAMCNRFVHKDEYPRISDKSPFNEFLYAQLVGTYYGMAWASLCLWVCLQSL